MRECESLRLLSSDVPRTWTDIMQTRRISKIMIAYSTEVGPLSSNKNRFHLSRIFTILSPQVGSTHASSHRVNVVVFRGMSAKVLTNVGPPSSV